MSMYRSLRQCIDDLEATGQLLRIDTPIDPNLEAAEIQRRVFRAGGPALLLTNVVGCHFPMLCNLFGTLIGVLILGTLNNGMTLLSINAYYQQITQGVVLLLAVGLDQLRFGGLSRALRSRT